MVDTPTLQTTLKLRTEPQTLLLDKRRIIFADYKQRKPSEDDYSTLLTKSTLLYDAHTKQLVVVYLELTDDCTDVVTVLERTRFITDTRRSGLPTTSRIFGVQPRSLPRRDFCTAATLAREDPEGHAIIASYAERISRYYQHFNPDLYARHAALTTKILPEWRLQEDGVFTSGIINFNNPLLYHLDAGNFTHVWSNMLVYRRDVSGGYLSLPEYDCALHCSSNSLTMFDGQQILHGVTPLHLHDEHAYRFSIVFYSLKQMWNCLPIDEELARAAQRRTDREFRRAGLKIEDLA